VRTPWAARGHRFGTCRRTTLVRDAPPWCVLPAQPHAAAARRRGGTVITCIGTNLALSTAEREWSGTPDATHHNPEMDD